MPTAAKIQWPQGQPLFEVQWRAVAESLAGNGIRSATDLEVTATANDLEIEVASGTAYYIGSESTLGTAETHTLTAGDGTHDRWDTIYLDTATDSSGVREGTPSADPEPPDVQGDELLLAVVYVPQNATDVPDSDVLNWRAQFSNEAEEVHYDDDTGVYGVSNVDAALDELQEAAQISAYPLAIGDLASPYSLPSITDMDAAGADLVDGSTVLYESANTWVRNEVVQALAAFTADEQFTSYPLPIGDLASPFALPSITDMDAAGTDLVDSTVGVTVWDTSAGEVPREQIARDQTTHLETASGTNTGYTTSGEEIVAVDTATNSAAFTVTLASSDAVQGREVKVFDHGGGAASNAITVDTEGTETIDGESSTTVDDTYGSLHFTWDGDEWVITGGTAAGAGVRALMEGAETGSVPASDQGVLIVDELLDGETIRVQKAVYTTATVEAPPSGADLELVTFDNAGGFTARATVASGDGTTIYDSVTGSPITSYENTSGGAQSIGAIVDNGSGASIDIVAKVTGDIV
jgi:hypothetical protein